MDNKAVATELVRLAEMLVQGSEDPMAALGKVEAALQEVRARIEKKDYKGAWNKHLDLYSAWSTLDDTLRELAKS